MSFRLTWLVLGALAGLSSAPSSRIRRGDTVLVAPGRYVENLGAYGDPGSAVLLP